MQYYEMSYGLNVEMHKQTEIAKRLNTLINQLLPFLQADHQQQVLQAVERAKQVTMQELNLIIGVSWLCLVHQVASTEYFLKNKLIYKYLDIILKNFVTQIAK